MEATATTLDWWKIKNLHVNFPSIFYKKELNKVKCLHNMWTSRPFHHHILSKYKKKYIKYQCIITSSPQINIWSQKEKKRRERSGTLQFSHWWILFIWCEWMNEWIQVWAKALSSSPVTHRDGRRRRPHCELHRDLHYDLHYDLHDTTTVNTAAQTPRRGHGGAPGRRAGK